MPARQRSADIVSNHEAQKNQRNATLYDALMKRNWVSAKALCRQFPERALHILTVHDDTVLHLVACAEQRDLAIYLLHDVPQEHLDKMIRQNHVGNTVLHEAAIMSDKALAEELLWRVPCLLAMRNNLGETALFQAARFGREEVFCLLSEKMSSYDRESQQTFLQRIDKTTILHIAVLRRHFGIAIKITEAFPHLVQIKDGDGMTALQLFSCDASNFSEERKRKELEQASMLAEVLIEEDNSWEATYPGVGQSKVKTHKYGFTSQGCRPMDKRPIAIDTASGGPSPWAGCRLKVKSPLSQIPLFLATKAGCIQIVRAILEKYPQAIEYTDHSGQTILHLAIKYRQLEIFELVKEMPLAWKRMKEKIDNKGNTILHMVGKKRKNYVPEKMLSPLEHLLSPLNQWLSPLDQMLNPLDQLQDELDWFDHVKGEMVESLINHQNDNMQTAEALFENTTLELHNEAKDWLYRTAERCSTLAALIATLAFAAAYTVPGGPNQSTGLPILSSRPFFLVFTMADGLSLAFALTAVVIFLSVPTSLFRFRDAKRSLPDKLTMGFTFLFLSVVMMMVAFASTMVLMIHQKDNWVKIVLCCVAYFMVGIFAMTNSHIILSINKNKLKRLKQAFHTPAS
ncbi:ankyrin repeat-containing protein ITN1-like [Malania oleifera]|uniref:ankyrin repeat-containing protein ITN1-like n=1 Tax=Malania oleifera TaxID=397392 RepID=UPI0025AEB425|nr:ankyrin repeat-containing protein ITN1-like [Malania oleifera]